MTEVRVPVFLYQGSLCSTARDPGKHLFVLSAPWPTPVGGIVMKSCFACQVLCVHGDAVEYAFCQLTQDVVGSYESLVLALETRFQDRRPAASYLAQLESRRCQPSEKLTEYIADLRKLVIKGYPTADESTRETLVLHHFLKGLPDRQAAVSVGMTNPTTVEEARTALETYGSLRDEAPKPPKARVCRIGRSIVFGIRHQSRAAQFR